MEDTGLKIRFRHKVGTFKMNWDISADIMKNAAAKRRNAKSADGIRQSRKEEY